MLPASQEDNYKNKLMQFLVYIYKEKQINNQKETKKKNTSITSTSVKAKTAMVGYICANILYKRICCKLFSISSCNQKKV